MLTDRQKETIKNINWNREIPYTPEEIIKYCQERMLRTYRSGRKKKLHPNKKFRRHSKKYYQEIIEHYLPITTNKRTNRAG